MTKRLLTSVAFLLLVPASLPAQEDAGPAIAPLAHERTSADANSLLGEPSAAVVAIQESNPTSAEDLIHAIIDLLRFGQLELAQEYAAKLAALNLEGQASADVGEAVGSAPLLKIISTQELGKPARTFCQKILDAVRQRKIDPARLTALVQAVTQPDATARRNAIVDLRSAGPASVQPLILILADRSQAAAHDHVRGALVQLGQQAVAPLLAVLDTRDPALQVEVLRVLGRIGSRDAWDDALGLSQSRDPAVRETAADVVHHLMGKVPDHPQVAKHLARTILDLLGGRRSESIALDGSVEKWRWNDAEKALTVHRVRPDFSAAITATRLASQLRTMRPDDLWSHRLDLLANLQLAKLASGLDHPLDKPTQHAILTSDKHAIVDRLDEVLALALDKNLVPAAIGASELLGVSVTLPANSSEILTRNAPTRSPLVRALSHSDRRVRHAATQAIVQLRPDRPFAGSSALIESLRYFANTTGQRRALVIDPRPSRSQLMSGLLLECDLLPDTFFTGAAGLRSATRRPDFEIALIAYTIERPRIRELVLRLREDPRTADLPIGMVASVQHVRMAEHLFADDPLIRVFVVPRAAATMQLRIDQLTAAAGAHFVAHDERLRQAKEAMRTIGVVAIDYPSQFDLTSMTRIVEPALYHPALSQSVAHVLSTLPTPAAQRALVDLASANAIPVADRRAAAQAFAKNVRKHGIGLTKRQIQQQADRYDATADQDKATEEIMWSILDALQTVGQQARSE